jgi:hypothetical protein
MQNLTFYLFINIAFAARKTTNAQLQKEWIQEQKREHDWDNQNNTNEEK